MFKKRLLAFGLAGVMVMGLNMSVLADDSTGTSDGGTAKATVDGTIPEKYTINIPTGITAYTDKKSPIAISATLVNLNANRHLSVKTAQSVGLTGTGLSLDVAAKVMLNDNPLNATAEVARFNTQVVENTLKDQLALAAIDNSNDNIMAGTYTGEMTFNISVEDGVVEP